MSAVPVLQAKEESERVATLELQIQQKKQERLDEERKQKYVKHTHSLTH
jgi:hypothetical protein